MLSTGTEVTTSAGATRPWQQRFRLVLGASDVAVLVAVIAIMQVLEPCRVESTMWERALLFVGLWTLLLTSLGTRDNRVIGSGMTEFRRIVDSGVYTFGLYAVGTIALHIGLAPRFVLVAFPVGIVTLLGSRLVCRTWLGAQRTTGAFTSSVLVVGAAADSARIASQLLGAPGAGYRVVGATISDPERRDILDDLGVPVVGDLSDVASAATRSGADTVIVTAGAGLTAEAVRRIGWSLEPSRQQLIVAPTLAAMSEPRMHARPVGGLPLLHVESPRYEGFSQHAKRAFDLVAALGLLVAFSPVLFAITALIVITSGRPVLYRQQRIGASGEPFTMLKFRSMRPDADTELLDLLAQQGTAGEPLFKVRDDPRVTRIGGFLRKFSLDELPQLLNVVAGTMSLVGPRPQRSTEVALYDAAARRRLLVKPGMTGLWQVSGRSALAWEEAVHLDLFYVENWSLGYDLYLLGRTFKAVMTPGASAF
jgi:exopolysaccharide biosynthesis polyprenyl glycosylphosphotransferase